MTSLTRKSRESQQIDLGSREAVAEQISHPLATLGDSRWHLSVGMDCV